MSYETNIKVPSTFWVIVVILITMPLVGFGFDMYVPSLPAIHRYFGGQPYLVQLTVSLFILGNGCTQVIFGTLSDAYGRRKIILWGSSFFVLFSLLASLASSIYFLLAMRFCQGVAVAACAGSARAIIPDVFNGDSYKKVTSLFTTVYCFAIIIAPFIGGYLQDYFGWHAIFYFLIGYSAMIFLLTLWKLPETHLQPNSIDMKSLFAQTRATVKNPVYLGGAIICGLLFGYSAIYAVMAPFLIQNILGKSAVFYGYIALILGVGALLGQIINRVLIADSVQLKVIISIVVVLCLSVGMLIWSFTHSLSILVMTLPVFIIYGCTAMAYPNVYGKVVQLFPDFTGFAASLCGTIIFMVMCLLSIVATFFDARTFLPLTALFTSISVLLLLCYFTMFYKK